MKSSTPQWMREAQTSLHMVTSLHLPLLVSAGHLTKSDLRMASPLSHVLLTHSPQFALWVCSHHAPEILVPPFPRVCRDAFPLQGGLKGVRPFPGAMTSVDSEGHTLPGVECEACPPYSCLDLIWHPLGCGWGGDDVCPTCPIGDLMCHNHCIDVDGVLQRNGSPIVQNGRVIPLVDKDGGAAAQFTVTTILPCQPSMSLPSLPPLLWSTILPTKSTQPEKTTYLPPPPLPPQCHFFLKPLYPAHNQNHCIGVGQRNKGIQFIPTPTGKPTNVEQSISGYQRLFRPKFMFKLQDQ